MAVSIDDLPALGRGGERAQMLPIGTRLQLVALEDLKVDEPGLNAGRRSRHRSSAAIEASVSSPKTERVRPCA
jgi:hypothetical protein